MQLFFSYARPDRLRVDSLVTRLRQAGIEIWLDSDLVGGWPWWDKILGQLRSCNAVLAAVSRASTTSQACRSEREYAAQLGKPILPIALEHMPAGLFPADIARLQIIDYTQPDETAAFRLSAAIFAMPKPRALPSPLPAPPALPQTRFSNLNDRIAAPLLSLEEQLGIIVLLEGALGSTSDQEDRETATEMLSEMAKRPDLYETAARKIQALQRRPAAMGPERVRDHRRALRRTLRHGRVLRRRELRPRNLCRRPIRGGGAIRRRLQRRSSLSPLALSRSSLSPLALSRSSPSPLALSRGSPSPPALSHRGRNHSSLSRPVLCRRSLNRRSLNRRSLNRRSLNRRGLRRFPRPVS